MSTEHVVIVLEYDIEPPVDHALQVVHELADQLCGVTHRGCALRSLNALNGAGATSIMNIVEDFNRDPEGVTFDHVPTHDEIENVITGKVM